MEKGIVKFYNTSKGWGYLTLDTDENIDVYLTAFTDFYMKKGETRKLDALMRIWQGADLTRKAYTTLFMKSPFSVRDGRADITKKAEAWLAAAKDDGDPPIDAGLAGDICSAVVFALREGEDEKPDLAPSFERSRRPVITSRIVNVEVFQ